MNLSITGTGAVTSAGWGVPALIAALASGKPALPSRLERPSARGTISTPVLRVPADGANSPKHPRLRRTSPISRFAAAAAIEALGESRLALIAAGRLRTGVIFTLTNGCVNYSNRFFGEVLADPSLASPILFPETVFNAPSSHLSALIGSSSPNDSLIGDASCFFTGMDLAAEWISRGEVDACLVVAAEEIDWLSAEALQLYSSSFLPAEGAAAILIEPADGPVVLDHLPDPIAYAARSRSRAMELLRENLAAPDDGKTLLVDGLSGIPRFDLPESSAWSDWTGPRLSPKTLLGDTMGASAGLQVIAAVEAIRDGRFSSAIVSCAGSNQQAAGAVFSRA